MKKITMMTIISLMATQSYAGTAMQHCENCFNQELIPLIMSNTTQINGFFFCIPLIIASLIGILFSFQLLKISHSQEESEKINALTGKKQTIPSRHLKLLIFSIFIVLLNIGYNIKIHDRIKDNSAKIIGTFTFNNQTIKIENVNGQPTFNGQQLHTFDGTYFGIKDHPSFYIYEDHLYHFVQPHDLFLLTRKTLQ